MPCQNIPGTDSRKSERGMAMAVHFYARFEKKNGSIQLTKTFNGEETEDVTEDIARHCSSSSHQEGRRLFQVLEIGF